MAGGADANLSKGPFRETALHYPAEYDKAASIPLLIEEGRADIEATTTNGSTLLSLAARFGACAAIADLIHLGAAVHAANEDG